MALDKFRLGFQSLICGLQHISWTQANVGATGGEAMYDQRLFNRDQGMGQGLANDEGYNLYDKALFVDRGSNLFKPSAATADDDDGPEGALEPCASHPFSTVGALSLASHLVAHLFRVEDVVCIK